MSVCPRFKAAEAMPGDGRDLLEGYKEIIGLTAVLFNQYLGMNRAQ